MYYSIFLETENDPVIKKWLNMNTKDEINKILKKLTDEEVKKVQIVETSIETIGEYDLIKRFINEKYPFYYAKDITNEIVEK